MTDGHALLMVGGAIVMVRMCILGIKQRPLAAAGRPGEQSIAGPLDADRAAAAALQER